MTVPHESFRIFMNSILDYAGLYPPASLPLEEAFQNFIDYQSSPEAWMLSRFIIPAKRLSELPVFTKNLSFSALGRGGKDADEFLSHVNLDISDINLFCESHPTGIVDMFEVALPAAALADKFTANDLVNRAADALNKNGITVFFEAPFGDGWQTRAEKLIRALRKVKDKHVGFKLRTGGVTADAFPSIEQVAWVIVETREAGIPLKCTAGLHHPVRHFNQSVNTKMHGFLNVFGAGVLAFTEQLSASQVKAILAEEDPSSFVFGEHGFAWKDVSVSASEIQEARPFVTSFGSCSFDEPREDLRSLGML
ncbi:MAG: hypothetical protein JNK32_07075 [Anaerolineales bacterium]|nr:hypothetical protein [Anaerolineales bacterium]